MGNFGVGDYVKGMGYVSFKKRYPKGANSEPKTPAQKEEPPNPEMVGENIQKIITKVFGTVPRNRLKEAGIDE